MYMIRYEMPPSDLQSLIRQVVFLSCIPTHLRTFSFFVSVIYDMEANGSTYQDALTHTAQAEQLPPQKMAASMQNALNYAWENVGSVNAVFGERRMEVEEYIARVREMVRKEQQRLLEAEKQQKKRKRSPRKPK